MSTKTEKYPKLPPVFKKKWLEALRNGKFQQGGGCLFDEEKNKYCCLGVACKIQGNAKSKLIGGYIDDPAIFEVPKILQGTDDENKVVAKLTSMNHGTRLDGVLQKKKTFKGIANWIEKNL